MGRFWGTEIIIYYVTLEAWMGEQKWSQGLQAGLAQWVREYMAINKFLYQYFCMNNNISKLPAAATALSQIYWESTTCCSAALIGLKSW